MEEIDMGFLPDRKTVVLRHILEHQAAEQPKRECLFFEDGERWTYEMAVQEAYRAANVLSGLGVRRGDTVLIALPNGQGFIRGWWGITSLGAVMVPMNLAFKGEMLRHVCQDSQARLIITTPDMGERIKALGLDLTVIDPSILIEGSSDEPRLEEPLEPWDIHAIIYTSGTTGPSKGVVQTYLFIYTSSRFSWGSRGTSEDTILVDHPLSHVSGISPSYALWALGGRVALRKVFSASRYLDIVKECGATMATMIGTTSNFLAATPPKPDDAKNPLRVVAPVPMTSDPDAFMARFGIEDLFIAWSMTETGTLFATQGAITNPKTCGKVRPGVQVRLVDEHDIPVPTGQVGELIARSDRPWDLNAGYWRRPEETARAWRNGWFHTGDLLYCDAEGNFFFADRKKDALRRRGENISSFEVEREVMAFPEVLEAACVDAKGELGVDFEQEVKVFVVPRDASTFDPAELIKFLIPRMPYFMIPRFIEVVPELPKSATNKVKKHELRALGNSAATWDREAAGIKVSRTS
jgi:crotonobetaine/carnitine-CoA ligase